MLYVFLHGLTVVGERPGNQIEIILPLVKGHVYEAGNWLAETPIKRGERLELKNVQAGSASVYNTGFLIDVPKQYPVTGHGRAATIMAPMPDEVLGVARSMDKVRHVLTLNTTPNPTFVDTLAEVTILVYHQADETQVYLDGHYWQPYSVQGAIGLHIIATSKEPEGEEHFEATEATLGQVFTDYPGLTQNRTPPRPLPAPWMDPKNLNLLGALNGRQEVEGRVMEGSNLAFALAELEHPSPRAQRLERLGRMLRAGIPINDAWQRPDPLTGSLCVCGTMSGNITAP